MDRVHIESRHSPGQCFHIEVDWPCGEFNIKTTQCIRRWVRFGLHQGIYHIRICPRLPTSHSTHKQWYDNNQANTRGQLDQCWHRIRDQIATTIQECEDQRWRVIADRPNDRQLQQINTYCVLLSKDDSVTHPVTTHTYVSYTHTQTPTHIFTHTPAHPPLIVFVHQTFRLRRAHTFFSANRNKWNAIAYFMQVRSSSHFTCASGTPLYSMYNLGPKI